MSRRQEKIKFSLPDALDLLVVCMEAGLGLDQAMVNVSRELEITHPEICQEFNLVSLEMRAGKRRTEALKNLASRAGEPELRKLVATLVQADRFGASIADSLRTHADFMRVRRRQEAEERAAKVGVKLPHSSYLQFRLGTPVSRADLKLGDLVFFYTPISHVGIYIGEGMMINATGFRVQISEVWPRSFRGGRRLL